MNKLLLLGGGAALLYFLSKRSQTPQQQQQLMFDPARDCVRLMQQGIIDQRCVNYLGQQAGNLFDQIKQAAK